MTKISKELEYLRSLDNAKLIQELHKAKRELMELRFKKVTMVLENIHELKRLKKKIARIKTILTERRVRGNVNE